VLGVYMQWGTERVGRREFGETELAACGVVNCSNMVCRKTGMRGVL